MSQNTIAGVYAGSLHSRCDTFDLHQKTKDIISITALVILTSQNTVGFGVKRLQLHYHDRWHLPCLSNDFSNNYWYQERYLLYNPSEDVKFLLTSYISDLFP
jgi:hypothetical protein